MPSVGNPLPTAELSDIKVRSRRDTLFAVALRAARMNPEVRSVLRRAWPFVGSLYLVYLALQPPPVRYVGVVGLAVVTPLLAGWVAGSVFGVGPWAGTDRT
jgi:hypothetical protein